MALYNKKYDKCTICGLPHYARGYCLKHYRNLMDGRQLDPQKCKVPGCNKKVLIHIKEGICSGNHWKKYLTSLHPIYKKDGGKWGYKDYRKYIKIKKQCCEVCGTQDELEIHHKDKNKKNSNPENIITLCQKCHLEHGHKGNFAI